MIAVDWGSSSLRVFRVNDAGEVISQRRSDMGVLHSAGCFASTLSELIRGWDDRLILMAGMIGSRLGWQEVPYVPCPAGAKELAAGMAKLPDDAFPGREIWLVPGLSAQGDDGAYDVMRGEETQIIGMSASMHGGRHWACLPGTHSKLAEVRDGCITGFSTAMTGELYDLLRQHSMLATTMHGTAHQSTAFARGVRAAEEPCSLLTQLFKVRTHGLFEVMSPEDLPSYLSGLLIGNELNDLPSQATTIHVAGAPVLVRAYSDALTQRGRSVVSVTEACIVVGLHVLRLLRGL